MLTKKMSPRRQVFLLQRKPLIVASHNMQENQWLEINITDGIKKLNVSLSHEEYLLMVKVVFKLDVCTKQYKKVPMKVVDPAHIPPEDKERREKNLTVQPMVIVYLDEQMKQQSKGGHLDEFH